VDRWVPRPHPKLFGRFPVQRDGARRKSDRKGQSITVEWLAEEPNGSPRSRHLLPGTAFRGSANPNNVLKLLEFRAFLLVRFQLHRFVASLLPICYVT
jgi:hypothetical protein